MRELSADEAAWLTLVENVQRSDLTPIEEAEAYQVRLSEGLTQTELGKRIGKDQSYIASKLRMLTLPSPIRLLVAQGCLTEGHAKQIMKLKRTYVGIQREFDLSWDSLPDRSINDWVFSLNELSPEDNPAGWFAGDSIDVMKAEVLAETSKAFFQYVVEHNQSVDQWVIAGTWWACAAYLQGASVSRLSKAIDVWESRFFSAIWKVHLFGDPVFESPEGEIQQYHYMLQHGWAADLRHSGSLEMAKVEMAEWPDAINNGVLEIMEEGYFSFPSSCQKRGSQHERFIELRSHFEAKREEAEEKSSEPKSMSHDILL